MARRRDALFAPLAGGTRADGLPTGRRGSGWTNPLTGQGGILDRHTRTVWTPPAALDHFTVDGLLQFDGLARRLCWREPYDGTREGFRIKVTGDEGGSASAMIGAAASDMPAIDNDSGRGSVLTAIARARQWARAYGGALIVGLFDDGRDYREPLDLANVRTLRGIRVLDRNEASVARWDDDTRSRRLGKPAYWQVQIAGVQSLFVHHSRVIQVQGNELPPRLVYQRQGWGGSMLDLVWIAFRNWQSSLEYLPEFVGLLTQGVFKQKGLADAMLAGQQEAVIRRYETLRAAMGVLGELAIDADEEDYSIMQRPVTGVAEIFEKLVEAFIACTDMPRSILLGETPGGLNTGENAGEVRAWYDYVASLQRTIYEPIALQLLKWICSAQDGPTQGAIPQMMLEWQPLWQPTRAENDAHELAQAQRRQIDVGVVGAENVRMDPALVRLYPGFDPAAANEAALPEDDPEGELDPILESPPSSMPAEPLIDARTAARRLGVGPGTIRQMAIDQRIRAWRVGAARRWRFAWTDIEDAVNGREVKPLPRAV